MKILRIIETADPAYGGPIEGARRVAEVWARQGHVQDMLTLDPPSVQFLSDYPGRIVGVGLPNDSKLKNPYKYSPHMVRWLDQHASDYDAVIVSGMWRYHARGAYQGLRGKKVPYFAFTHGMLDPWFRKTAPLKHWGKQLSWLFAEGPMLNNARRVFFTTEEEMRLAENAFWPYRLDGAVVSYGTRDVEGDAASQIAAFRASVPALQDSPFLLFLSRIHQKKGCDLLVEAFSHVARNDPSLNLVIAGPDQVGLIAELRKLAERLGIADRLHFPGMLTGDIKTGAFRAAQAFVLPSHQENFGIAVAEALACGTPVLISDKVNIWREVVADGAGLVAPDTQSGTTDLLCRFAALTPAERTIMGGRARTSFLTRFQIDSAADSLLRSIAAAL